MEFSPRSIARGALIGALYVVATLVFSPISFGPVQLRVADSLAVLPFLWVEAVPGLFVGCLIANIFGGLGIWDVVLGSAATLVAAWLSSRASTKLAAALWPVVINGVVVGAYLGVLFGMPVVFAMLYVAAGEAIACFALGLPLIKLLERRGAI